MYISFLVYSSFHECAFFFELQYMILSTSFFQKNSFGLGSLGFQVLLLFTSPLTQVQ
jgi:hypothetical protein